MPGEFSMWEFGFRVSHILTRAQCNVRANESNVRANDSNVRANECNVRATEQ